MPAGRDHQGRCHCRPPRPPPQTRPGPEEHGRGQGCRDGILPRDDPERGQDHSRRQPAPALPPHGPAITGQGQQREGERRHVGHVAALEQEEQRVECQGPRRQPCPPRRAAILAQQIVERHQPQPAQHDRGEPQHRQRLAPQPEERQGPQPLTHFGHGSPVQVVDPLPSGEQDRPARVRPVIDQREILAAERDRHEERGPGCRRRQRHEGDRGYPRPRHDGSRCRASPRWLP